MPGPLVWIAGDDSHRDFAAARRWLTDNVQAVSAVNDSGFPRAIVFFQSRPGQISQDEFQRLQRRAPLARLIAVVGSLCEGERRLARGWQGVARMYWHQAVARLPAELGFGSTTSGGAAGSTKALTDAELLLRRLGPTHRRNPRRESVAICTSRRSDFQALADACSIAGWLTAWQAPGQPPKSRNVGALLVDGWESLPAGSLKVPVVVLLDFPRPDDLDRAAELGIQHVLARPLLITDLLAALNALAATPAARTVGVA